MSKQQIYGTGISVPVSKDAADFALGAAMAAGASIYTYRDQQASLNKYDKALGIDVNLPKDVRKQLRDKAFRDQGERPPVSAGLSVVYLWAAVAVALFVIFALGGLILAAV